MKKLMLSLCFALTLYLTGCADNPLTSDGRIGLGGGTIQISLNNDKGITITPCLVTNAVITLTYPSGTEQSAVWNYGGQNVFTFSAVETGIHTLGITQTDISNNVITTNVSCNFQKGFDYTVTISLGGAIIMNFGTNGSSSSVNSVSSGSSSRSSVSSSSSAISVSSGSSSSSSSKSSSLSSSSSSSSVSSDGITVYTAGKVSGAAYYWINTTPYDISESAYSYATGISVSGTDVYVSGRRNIGYACYWKNGVPVTLSDHMLSVANDIFVSGGNVTAVGNYLTSWYPFQPMVWVNGSGSSLSGRSLSSVTVDASSVYISGQGGAATTVASYWIIDGSGTRQFNLTPDTNGYYSDATGIAEANGTVYVAGFYYLSGASDYVAAYWYGNAGTSLNQVLLETTRPSRTGKACFSGTTLYISGYYNNGVNNIACYWAVNPGTGSYRVDLGTAGLNSSASAITLSGTTVVVSGYQNNGTNNIACYWKNGVRTDVGPAGLDSSAEGVTVR